MSRIAFAAAAFLLIPALSCTRASGGKDAAAEVAAVAVAPPKPAGPLGTPTGIRVIDFHAHFDPRFPDLMLQRMDEAGIAMTMNYSGGTPRGLQFSIDAEKASDGRLRFFCVIPWGATAVPDFVGQVVQFLRDCRQRGGMGVKITKGLGLGAIDPATGGLLKIDDPWLDPIFEEAGRLGMPVSEHAGDPQAFFRPCDATNERFEELSLATDWCFADRSKYPAWEDIYSAFIRRVARHPGTTFVGVHFGNDPEEPLRVGRMMREHPNLYIDTAARVPEIGRRSPAEVQSVFAEFPDRIMFGTDLQVGPEGIVLGAGPHGAQDDVATFWRSTWRYFETTDAGIPSPTPIQGRWTVQGIGLSHDALVKLYHGNAERLLGLDTAPAADAH